MIELFVSLTGIIFGLLLAKIAPEEMEDGKKYFIFIKRLLFIIILVVVSYYFIVVGMMIYFSLFLLLMIILFILELKLKNKKLEISNYIIFIAPYFLINQRSFHLTLASLIFLYGLPLGSLLKSAYSTSGYTSGQGAKK